MHKHIYIIWYVTIMWVKTCEKHVVAWTVTINKSLNISCVDYKCTDNDKSDHNISDETERNFLLCQKRIEKSLNDEY